MNTSKMVLIVDAAINLLLGILLLLFSAQLARLLGVPAVTLSFYPNILGGVLFGIGLALLIECFRPLDGLGGLGLGGAIAINLCGSVVLVAWLITGKLSLPLRGQILLWTLALVLMVISALELHVHLLGRTKSNN